MFFCLNHHLAYGYIDVSKVLKILIEFHRVTEELDEKNVKYKQHQCEGFDRQTFGESTMNLEGIAMISQITKNF